MIKDYLRKLIPTNIIQIKRGLSVFKKRNPDKSFFDIIRSSHLITSENGLYYLDDYVRQFSLVVSRMKLDLHTYYIYPFDKNTIRIFNRAPISSVTVDYGKILKSDLRELQTIIDSLSDKTFIVRERSIINSLEIINKRILNGLKERMDERGKTLSSYFQTFLYRAPLSLDEAIQKLLFYNALFWQMGHSHIGLGRLDYILKEYYEIDIEKAKITEEEAKSMLRHLLLILGKDTIAKSLTQKGDTGQYILLGGIDHSYNNVDNKLTEFFIELMDNLHVPDPKLILRVNNNTPKIIWEKSIKCILTGIGSPLIMDETSVMKKMIGFGYKPEDVWNVGTSACWEPLIIGKSFDQNNPFTSIIAINPLNKIILDGGSFNSFETLMNEYKKEYKKEILLSICDINFDCSPLFTLFFEDCIKREKDFSDGGAIYSYHGAQVVSFPNTINALLNIKEFVFEKKIVSFDDCRKAIVSNFHNMEDFRSLLTSSELKFGSTDEVVINLTNELINYTGEVVKDIKCNGQPIKVGFSSPTYISASKKIGASLDGRRAGTPFAVHISPISSKIDISEILDFSSKLKYHNCCINGNVVDFILPSSYVKQSEKLISILKDACNKGMFEIQLNVMDKATLIDAKNHPEKYPNLIVRVWGFSAYFNDLPEEFKDNLIQRAEIYEAA